MGVHTGASHVALVNAGEAWRDISARHFGEDEHEGEEGHAVDQGRAEASDTDEEADGGGAGSQQTHGPPCMQWVVALIINS